MTYPSDGHGGCVHAQYAGQKCAPCELVDVKAERDALLKFKTDVLRVMQNGEAIKEINRLREEVDRLKGELQAQRGLLEG